MKSDQSDYGPVRAEGELAADFVPSCTAAARGKQSSGRHRKHGIIAATIGLIVRSTHGMCYPFIELLRSLAHGEIPRALRLWPATQYRLSDAASDTETEEAEHAALRAMLGEFIAEVNADIDHRLDAALATIHEVAGNALEQLSESSSPAAERHADHAEQSPDQSGVHAAISLHALQTNMADVLSEIEDLVRQHRNANAGQSEHMDEEKDLASAIHYQVQALRDVSFAVETAAGRAHDEDGSTLTDFAPMKVIEAVCLALGSRARSAGIEVYGSVAQEMPSSVRGNETAFRRIVYLLLYTVLRSAESASLDLNLTVDRIEDEYVYINLSLNHPMMAYSDDTLRKIVAAVNNDHSLEQQLSTCDEESIALFWIAQQVALHEGSRLHVNTESVFGMTIHLRFRWRITPTEDSERRVNSRFRLEMVKSSHGPVIDLSRSGARIRSNQRLRGELELEIKDAETTVQIPCRVCWVKQQGWRKYDVGLQFLDVSPDIAKRITTITMRNRWARTISET